METKHTHAPWELCTLTESISGTGDNNYRLADIPDLQATVDSHFREKLAEADSDISAGRVAPWDGENIKQRGLTRLSAKTNGK